MAQAYRERIKHVHLKDVRTDVVERAREESLSFQDAIEAGVFTVPGDGSIDFVPIFEALASAGFEGWLVVEAEQDPAKATPLEYALKGRAVPPRSARLVSMSSRAERDLYFSFFMFTADLRPEDDRVSESDHPPHR